MLVIILVFGINNVYSTCISKTRCNALNNKYVCILNCYTVASSTFSPFVLFMNRLSLALFQFTLVFIKIKLLLWRATTMLCWLCDACVCFSNINLYLHTFETKYNMMRPSWKAVTNEAESEWFNTFSIVIESNSFTKGKLGKRSQCGTIGNSCENLQLYYWRNYFCSKIIFDIVPCQLKCHKNLFRLVQSIRSLFKCAYRQFAWFLHRFAFERNS